MILNEINIEIVAIYQLLFKSNYNLQKKEREYLYNKLLDLNHCYLLELYRKGVLGKENIEKTLKKRDYTIKNVAGIIPAYYYDYINNGIFNSDMII